ncbi:hisactophilin c49s mutant phototropin phy3 fusion protein [Phlyctema vagabunda]|uniref:Hisactophilin c49s mutant phototropin phy3 fusion protein n=1 Tax=Phlyctema vagabunda TaxID=108571 RepID=A0ABR4P7U0_9HELO
MNILKSSERRTHMAHKMTSIFNPTVARREANQQADSAEPPTVPYYRARQRPDSAASATRSEHSLRFEEQPPLPVAKPPLITPKKTTTSQPVQGPEPDPERHNVVPQAATGKQMARKERRMSGESYSMMESRVQSSMSVHRSPPDSQDDSEHSYETNATSLPALQSKGPPDESDPLAPLAEEDLDPGSFDLVAPAETGVRQYSLETRSEQLFSTEHLKVIFADPSLLLRFTAFLSASRPKSIPILIYYLDAVKALKAIQYSNAIAEALDPIDAHDFTKQPLKSTANVILEDRAKKAFEALVRDDLPAYVTHIYIQTVSLSIQRRITGTLPAHLREASEGLAEVFCLTDPSRPDNPIVFASEGRTAPNSSLNKTDTFQSFIERHSME